VGWIWWRRRGRYGSKRARIARQADSKFLGETPKYRAGFRIVCLFGIRLRYKPFSRRKLDQGLRSKIRCLPCKVCGDLLLMTNLLTHFEVYGERPKELAEFYRKIFGWQIEQMEGIEYWRINTGSEETNPLNGGLTYKALPDLHGWMLYVQVPALEETVELVKSLGGAVIRPKTAVPRAAWVTIVADPAKNIFGVWQADPNAFPMPHPD